MMSDRRRAAEWFEGAEARNARARRTTVLLQSLERDVSNPHRRGGLTGLIHSVIQLLMFDAYEAGLRDGAASVPYPPVPPPVEAAPRRTWMHGTRLGREHTSVRQHLVEDHGEDPDVVRSWSDGAVHGTHDEAHSTTWAYAVDLPHERTEKR